MYHEVALKKQTISGLNSRRSLKSGVSHPLSNMPTEVESSPCSMNTNKGPWAIQGDRTGASLLLDGTWVYGWNEDLMAGEGIGHATYATNWAMRGAMIEVSRRMREKGHQRGTSWNLHWASSFKKYRRASKEILVFFADHRGSRYD